MRTTKHETLYDRIRAHGNKLLRIFPQAAERDPVQLCKKLRRIELMGSRFALRLCNGPEFPSEEEQEAAAKSILKQANKLLGNVHEHQPKTGEKCGCRRGVQRDNCPNCEGTGYVIDFHAIRNRKALVPVFLNRDPRGYSLKIPDEYVSEHELDIHRDWGGYGILAPDFEEG